MKSSGEKRHFQLCCVLLSWDTQLKHSILLFLLYPFGHVCLSFLPPARSQSRKIVRSLIDRVKSTLESRGLNIVLRMAALCTFYCYCSGGNDDGDDDHRQMLIDLFMTLVPFLHKKEADTRYAASESMGVFLQNLARRIAQRRQFSDALPGVVKECQARVREAIVDSLSQVSLVRVESTVKVLTRVCMCDGSAHQLVCHLTIFDPEKKKKEKGESTLASAGWKTFIFSLVVIFVIGLRHHYHYPSCSLLTTTLLCSIASASSVRFAT